MLENQIVQKSSDIAGINSIPVNPAEGSGRIYLDPQQAIADFDSEGHRES